MRISLVAMVLAASITSSSAYATGAIECSAPDGEASISLTLGSLPIVAIVGAQIMQGEKQWTIGGEGENTILAGQAFGTADELRVDFTDINVERIIAELRLFIASEGRDMVTAGTLKFAGVGVYALNCTGP